jgi:hypothetical protein
MPRITVYKADNKLLEMQSDATPGTLIANAVSAGIDPALIEEKVVTDAEFQVYLDVINAPAIAIAERERKINEEIRKGPIAALIARGEITP